MKKVFVVTAAVAILCIGVIAHAHVTIETVAIGDPGNAADGTGMGNGTGYGSVGYNYNIGKYEVTAGQYTEFLNAVASTDTYGLYSIAMTSPWGCQIKQTGFSGNFKYSVASEYANRPVSSVSYWDACRFANWMCNGQGLGSTESGAYTLTSIGIENNTITRNTGATWAIASENEWYKAAYYNGNGVYSLYANGTNVAPGIETDSNYGGMTGTYTTPWDGTISGALEQNGTKDMMGNVLEYNEAIIAGTSRGVRGGSFVDESDIILRSTSRSLSWAVAEGAAFGFRVVQITPVPEPSSMIALAGGLVGLLGITRRKA